MLKKKSGITLIALVITIIVLLILAAVSINALIGENGIANKAKDASKETVLAEIKEEILLAYDESLIEEADNGVILTEYMQNLLRKKDSEATVKRKGNTLEVIYRKQKLEIANGQILDMGNYEIPTVSGIKLGEFGLAVLDSNTNVFVTERTHLKKIYLDEKSDLYNLKIIDQAAGSSHVMLLDDKNRLWGWGSNQYGNVGTDLAEARYDDITYPVCISEEEGNSLEGVKIVQVEVGMWHTVVLDSNGKVWTFGMNQRGELGNGTTTGFSWNPDAICLSNISSNPLYNKKIVKVFAGDHSSAALDEDGKLWVWGCNEYGNIGTGTTSNILLPICINNISNHVFNNIKIIDVDLGALHSVYLDSDNKLWIVGVNESGNLGDGTTVKKTMPICLTDMESNPIFGLKIAKARVSGFATVVLDANGKVWTWGPNNYGQVGDGTKTNAKLPVCLSTQTGNTIQNIQMTDIVGGYTSSIALDTNGKVWTWGSTTTSTLMPKSINDFTTDAFNNMKVKKIAGSNQAFFAFDEENEFWIFGNGDCIEEFLYYSGYNGITPIHFSPSHIYKFEQIASSAKKIESNSNSIYAIDKNQKIYDVLNNVNISDSISTINNIKFKDLHVTDSFFFAIDENGKLWEITSNSAYCMNDAISTFANVKVKDISVMGSYLMLIDSAGKIWSINASAGELLCLTDTISEISGQKFTSIGSNATTFVLDENSKVWEIYLDSESNSLEAECLTEIYDDLTNIKQISVGLNHVLALDSYGNVYMWNGYVDETLYEEPDIVAENVKNMTSYKDYAAFLYNDEHMDIKSFVYFVEPS